MSIEDRIDSFPEAWRPQAGDKLVGTVAEVGERESEYSPKPYPIVTVTTDEGKQFAFHGFHTVAKNELSKQRPEVGDRIGIKYFGKDEDKGYERYRVLVEHVNAPEVGVDWDTMEKEAEAEMNRPSDPSHWAD